MVKLPISFVASILCGITALTTLSVRADEIILKTGEKLTGRITSEADDFVKIEIPVSESIKETKLIMRADIETVTKEAPDNVAFAKLQNLIPTDSLLSANAYKSLIETGPGAFLREFPDSKHVEEVKKMNDTLFEELDQVERGFIKLEGEFISPQDQAEFASLTESRITLLRMERFSQSGNYNGLIGAMRQFERLEENYVGTPAFVKGLETAKQIVPALGRQLQGMKRDVEYRNQEFEKNKAAMDDIARQGVEAARAREEAQFKAALEADKKQGIKWVSLNPRSASSIDDYLSLAASENKRLQEYNIDALTEQSLKLVDVDKMIADGKLDLAKSKLAEAAAITGKSVSKGSKKSGGSGSYVAALSKKVNDRISAQNAEAKAREEARKSQELTSNLKSGETGTEGLVTTVEGEGEEKMEEKPKGDAFSALSQKKEKPVEEEKADDKKKKSKSSDDEDEDEEKEKKERPAPVVEESGGISLSLLIPIIFVVILVGVVVANKVFGFGAKKEEDEVVVEKDEE